MFELELGEREGLLQPLIGGACGVGAIPLEGFCFSGFELAGLGFAERSGVEGEGGVLCGEFGLQCFVWSSARWAAHSALAEASALLDCLRSWASESRCSSAVL